MIVILFINVFLAALALYNSFTIKKLNPKLNSDGDVKIILPIRNEAHNLPNILESLHAELHNSKYFLTIIDDQSTDDSLAIIKKKIATWEIALQKKVIIVEGGNKPDGWVGKSWATYQGLDQKFRINEIESEYLLFIDADINFAPGVIKSALYCLNHLKVDLLCPYPKQIAKTWPEKLIQPFLHWSWSTTLFINQAGKSKRSSTVVANGQFMLMRTSAYKKSGGVEKIRTATLDDMALARAIRSTGGKTTVIDGSNFITCRMYQNWEELQNGYTKSLWEAFGGSVNSLLVIFFYLITVFLPIFGIFKGNPYSVTSLLFILLSRFITAIRYEESLLSPLLHPIGILIFAYLLIKSNVNHARGKLSWKGRTL